MDKINQSHIPQRVQVAWALPDPVTAEDSGVTTGPEGP